MQRKWNRALSALLVIAMMATMLIVPVGAAEVPAEKTWDFASGTGWTDADKAHAIQNATEVVDLDGLKVDVTKSGKFTFANLGGGNWVQANTGTVIKVPAATVAGYHPQVTVKAYSTDSFKVNGKFTNSETAEQTFDCVPDGDGTITVEAVKNDYLWSIKLAYVEGDLTVQPSMTLDKKYLDLSDSGTETGTATATISDGKATKFDVAVAEGGADIVDAAITAEGVLTVTPKAVGDTSVTVSATLESGEVDPITLPVSVWDADGTTSWDFMHASFQKTGNKKYRGLTLASANVNAGYGVGTSGNLTIPVAGKSTITVVVGYTWNLSMDNGTVTSGNAANPADDKSGKDVEVVIDYTGAAGTATLTCTGSTYIKSIKVEAVQMCTKTPGCTLENGHAGDCVVETKPDVPADAVQAGTIDFQAMGNAAATSGADNNTRVPVTNAPTGVSVSDTCKLQVLSSHGLNATADASTITLKLGAEATVTLVECQYGKEKIAGVTAGETPAAVEIPERWDMSGGDKEIVFEKVPAGDMVLTLNNGAFIHSIKVDYATTHTPQMKLSTTVANLDLGGTESATVTAMTRFTDGAVKAVSKDESVATATVSGKTVTIEAKGEGQTTVDVTVEGTELKETVSVDVAAAGAVFVEGKLYSFATADNENTVKGIRGLSVSNDFVYGNPHGIQNKVGSTITLKLEKKANITVVGCTFGTGKNLEIASTSGKVTKELGAWNSGETDVPKFKIAGASGETTLTLTGTGTWIHSIEVTYLAEDVPAADRRIQVWDFGGKVESNTALYTNHITPDTLLSAKKADGTPTIVAGIIKTAQNTSDGTEFGNVVFAAGNNDKFYSNVTELASLAGGYADDTHAHDFGDGYVSAGGFITNGGGNVNRRNVTVKAVKAGEVVTAYLSNNQADTTFEVEGYADIPKVTVASKDFGVMSFVAPEEGNYKIWANGGKPGFLRVTVTPTVTVTGSITLPAAFNATDWVLKFVDPATKTVTEAEVDKTNNTYTVELAPGRAYSAAISGAPGWGVNADTRALEFTADKITTGVTHDLTVDVRPQYTYSGAITGFADGYDTSKLVVTMVPDEDSVSTVSAEEIDLTLTGKDFTGYLDCEVKYTVTLKGVNDYQVKSPAEVTSASADLTGQTIEVEPKAVQAVSGKLLELDVDDQFAPLKADSTYKTLSAAVTKLEFENVEDGYVYPAAVTNGSYTVDLRAGSYLAKATVEGFSTQTHVVVGDKAVSRDLLFVSTATPAAVDYAADVYVGAEGKSPNFKTVTGALDYIERMTRTDGQRVTVHIAPGTYREQISIDAKNVTFINDDPSKEVKLTWYYGIGYKYFSAKYVSGTECWYDPQLAFDRYEKADYDVSRWGATVRVRAPGFQAENVTFENSFNYYVTDEEVSDGVEYNGKQSIKFARDPGADVTSKAATERAAAIWVDTNNGKGDMTEFKNCKFLSSQDTVGTGKRMYFKDCYIEGMTDYICGPGDVVFDTCTLNWKGYSEKEVGGYLTAPQTGAAEKGYLFRNCYVSGDTKLMLVGGALGRTWGAENTKCLYLNTTLQSADMITEPTWIEMQGFDPAGSSTLLEWGTQLEDGTKVDLSTRKLQNTVLKAAPTVDVKGDYFGDWTPTYYVEEAATVAIEGNVSIVDNGDINLPYPGHTLTVVYSLGEANDANDASVIQWYAVKDGAEKLVKSSFANADKTYKIDKADIGAQIKVTVTPTTLSGKTGEAKSATVEMPVQDGYDDPSGATDPELGDGVNIFLAGDSTVKHYGATGMHQNGAIGKEGSWGEFLQAYFNDKVNVANYANGGRSTRNFINEGKLDSIAKKIGEGDYLFIQFGHNDCADGASYIEDRYVPLGTPDANGVYPVTPGTKSATPESLQKQYGAQWYAWDCGGTYKWFLQQYIDVAKNAGATPVLITPVSRMYYNSDGTIKPHHDDSKTQNNAYCEAVKQLAEEQNVLLIDGYALTAKMYEDAYKAGGSDTNGQQVMAEGDKTHSNKLGGMIEAALIAQAVQDMGVNISKTVQAPGALTGKTHTGATAFTVDSQGKFTAYDMLKDYAETAPYWMGVGQELIDAIAAKAAELNGGSDTPVDPTKPADKTALNSAIADAEKKAADTYTVSDDTVAADVDRGTKFVTESDKAALADAIAAAKAVADNDKATEAEVTKAVADLKAAVTAFNKAIKTGTKGGSSPSTGGHYRPSGSRGDTTTTVTNPDGTKATTTTNASGDKTITVKGENGETLAEISLPATIPAPKTKFVDVPEGHWAEKAINDMAGLGMVKGVSENTYDMTSPMTRASIATIFYRLSNGAEGKTTTFADVAQGTWYSDAVGWAAATGVVNGYSETAFGPEDTITRQQLAVMIARYARLLGLDTAAAATELDTFTDGSATDGWAVGSMAWCVKTGVMKGRGDGTVDPKAEITRAEAAVMLDRMIGLLK